MRLIELTIEDIELEGVFGLSLVEEPANETAFMLFSKEMFQFSKVDVEKKIITGLVIQPNKKIKRHIKGELVDVYFSAETIEKMSQNYLRDFLQFSTSVDHKKEVDDIFLVESWLVTDPKKDKANALGFKDIQKGNWYVSLKIENDEVLKNIKDGKYKGFSLEGLFNQKIVKMSEEAIVSEDIAEHKPASYQQKEEKQNNNETDISNKTLFDNIKDLFKKKNDEMSEEKKTEEVKKEVVEPKKDEVKKEVVEPKKDEVKEPIKEEVKVEEKAPKEAKEPVVDDKMQKILDRLENLEKENEDLKVEVEKKAQLDPKMTKEKNVVPQTFSQRMQQQLDNTRKKLQR